MDQNFIVNLLQKAKEEAFMKGINANSVIIDENLRYVKPFCMVTNYSTNFFKPMILGMEIDVQKLPEPISFIVYESDLTDNQKLINSIRKQSAKEILQEFSPFRAVSFRFSKVFYEMMEKFDLTETEGNDDEKISR